MSKFKILKARKSKAVNTERIRKLLHKEKMKALADLYKFTDSCSNIGSVGNGL